MIREVASNLRRGIIRCLYGSGYRSLVGSAGWHAPLMSAVDLHPGERVVEICGGVAGVSAELARRHPDAHVYRVHTDGGPGSAGTLAQGLTFEDGRIDSGPSSFDKAICTMAIHAVPEHKKLSLLRDIRRVLRQNGILYVVDLDQGIKSIENILLRAAATQYGASSVRAHLDGRWLTCLTQAGFTSLKQLDTFSITIGRISLIRGRKA